MKTTEIATLADLMALKNEILVAISSIQNLNTQPKFVNSKTLAEMTGIKSYNSLIKNFKSCSKKVGGRLLFDVNAVCELLKK